MKYTFTLLLNILPKYHLDDRSLSALNQWVAGGTFQSAVKGAVPGTALCALPSK